MSMHPTLPSTHKALSPPHTLAVLTHSPPLAARAPGGARSLNEPCPGSCSAGRSPSDGHSMVCGGETAEVGAGQETECEVARMAETQGKTMNAKRKPTTCDPSISTFTHSHRDPAVLSLASGNAYPRLPTGSRPLPFLSWRSLAREELAPTQNVQRGQDGRRPSLPPSLTSPGCTFIFSSCPPHKTNLDLRNQTWQLYLVLNVLQLPGPGKICCGQAGLPPNAFLVWWIY